MSVIDRVKSHFETLKTITIEVPEWKDENGNPRPFAFLPIGGSTNGSTLVGHNYTYVGSTWGRIVDILIEKKCMNPIIFIDELDKVSRSEHGKEIIGILTHLVDETQNDSFQDKYFTGIDLDLSKALFIFSFNSFIFASIVASSWASKKSVCISASDFLGPPLVLLTLTV